MDSRKLSVRREYHVDGKEDVMKKIKPLLLCCLVCLLCFSLVACRLPWAKYFYDYHVSWYSDDPFVEFVGDDYDGIGKIILNGTEYNFCIAAWDATTRNAGFGFYNYDTHGEELSDEDLIWEGKAEVKDGQLILTIEKDNISNYEGKTIVLNQRPIEDDVS